MKNDLMKVQKYVNAMYNQINETKSYTRDLVKVQKYVDRMNEKIEIYKEIEELTQDLMAQAEAYAERMFDLYDGDLNEYFYYNRMW